MRDGHIIVDIKSTEDAGAAAFQKTIADYGYHTKAAFYLDGVSAVLGANFDDFTIIAVEKTPPFEVHVIRINAPSINEGRALYLNGLKKLKQCQDSGKWPAYPQEITPLDIAPWSFKSEVL